MADWSCPSMMIDRTSAPSSAASLLLLQYSPRSSFTKSTCFFHWWIEKRKEGDTGEYEEYRQINECHQPQPGLLRAPPWSLQLLDLHSQYSTSEDIVHFTPSALRQFSTTLESCILPTWRLRRSTQSSHLANLDNYIESDLGETWGSIEQLQIRQLP